MNVQIRAQEHLVRVSLSGACTLGEAADLRRALQPLAGETTAVMVELDGITALDSDGLQVLLGLRRDCPTVFFCFANSLVRKTLAALDPHQQLHDLY